MNVSMDGSVVKTQMKLVEYKDGSGYVFFFDGGYPEDVPPYFQAVINYFNHKLEALETKKEAHKPDGFLHRMKEIMVTLDCDAKQALEIIKYENGKKVNHP